MVRNCIAFKSRGSFILGLSVNAIKAKYKGPRLTEDEEEDEEDEFLAMDRSAKRRKMKKAKPEALKAIEKKSDQPEVKDKVSDETTSKEKDESKKRSVSERKYIHFELMKLE